MRPGIRMRYAAIPLMNAETAIFKIKHTERSGDLCEITKLFDKLMK